MFAEPISRRDRQISNFYVAFDAIFVIQTSRHFYGRVVQLLAVAVSVDQLWIIHSDVTVTRSVMNMTGEHLGLGVEKK